MPDTPRMPSVSTMKRTDTEYPGKVPSRDPDHDGDPRAHHEVGDTSPRHRPDPRGLREYDVRKPWDADDDRRMRRDDSGRRDSVRDAVEQHLQHERWRR